MEEGRLTNEEELYCRQALGPDIQATAYVVCKIYTLQVGEGWVFTGLVGPMFIGRKREVEYLMLVDMSQGGYDLRMIHEVYTPFEMRLLDSHFYYFESDQLGCIIGMKACEGETVVFLSALSKIIFQQESRSTNNSNPGAMITPSIDDVLSESPIEMKLRRYESSKKQKIPNWNGISVSPPPPPQSFPVNVLNDQIEESPSLLGGPSYCTKLSPVVTKITSHNVDYCIPAPPLPTNMSEMLQAQKLELRPAPAPGKKQKHQSQFHKALANRFRGLRGTTASSVFRTE